MSFQSSKINAETVLHFPGGVATAQVLSSQAAPATAEPLLPVLIVLHQEASTPGRVGNVLRALGHRLDIRRPRFGDPLPKTLDGHAGAVIFGGPMSANDPDDFVRQEIDWIAVPRREQRPRAQRIGRRESAARYCCWFCRRKTTSTFFLDLYRAGILPK